MVEYRDISKNELLKLKNKYIFHGSPSLFNICKPHQAKCNTNDPLNEQNAIYGTNNLEFAILFAFEKLPKDKYDWCVDYDGNSYYCEMHGDTYIDENSIGYLYCFKKEYFTPIKEGNVQYVCYKELVPVQIYRIFYKDYKELFVNVSLKEINMKCKNK